VEDPKVSQRLPGSFKNLKRQQEFIMREADALSYNFSVPIFKMKTAPTFEIKVAVMGPVSAGKSTLINAMLVGKYSEVSIQRTTASVNFFRLSPPPLSPPLASEPSQASWPMVPDKSDAEEDILKEISTDNKALRGLDEVGEKTFEVEGVHLCDTREDTKVVIVDIPGINEADSSSKYRDYVTNHWDQFDCVILVMDARHGVNTEEQIGLLELVKTNLKDKKDLPVIILFNKVDELDHEEENEVLQEARDKISSLFGIKKSRDIAQEIIDCSSDAPGNLKNLTKKGKYLPIFLPISARNGYVFRLAPVVDESRFMELEKDLVEALGREQIGVRRWNKLTKSEKYKKAYEAISDPEVYKEELRTSNFGGFLQILSHCIGGTTTQDILLGRQVKISLKSLKGKPGLAKIIDSLYDKMEVFGSQPKTLKVAFWKLYQKLESSTLDLFPEPELSAPIRELVLYHRLAVKANWPDEVDRAIKVSRLYLNLMVDAALKYQRERHGDKDIVPMMGLMLSEMLDMSDNQHYKEHFNLAKKILEGACKGAPSPLTASSCPQCSEAVLTDYHLHYSGQCYEYCTDSGCPIRNCSGVIQDCGTGNKRCNHCTRDFSINQPDSTKFGEFEFKDGQWKVVNTNRMFQLAKFDRGPSDPKHYGHPFWIFCHWMEILQSASLDDE
jgi:GTPase SAR1 family protein